MGDLFGNIIIRPFGLIILQIYKLIGSYGISIILFALLVKIILMPLAYKSKKNMMQMSALQPELNKLQKQYANNREKLALETQNLYAKYKISPTSGCLTQFIQLPVIIGLYSAVRQPMKYMLGFGDAIIEKLGAFVGIHIAEAGVYAQITISEQLNQLYQQNNGFPQAVKDIVGNVGELIPLDFNMFGLDLSVVPSLKEPSILWLIPILSGLTAFISMIIMQRTQKMDKRITADDPTQKSMRMMNWISPVMSLYFGFIFPGTIGIYWIFNNIFSCLQDLVLGNILRAKLKPQIEEIERELAASKSSKKKSKKGGETV